MNKEQRAAQSATAATALEKLTDELSALVGDKALEADPDWQKVDDPDRALAIRGVLEDVRNTLNFLIERADERVIWLWEAMRFDPDEERLVPGGGVLKFSGGKQVERYDQEQILSQFAEAFAREAAAPIGQVIDAESGEVHEPIEVMATVMTDFVKVMADATGAGTVSYDGWRKGVAKKYGVDLKRGAIMETTPVRVRIEGRKKA